MNETLAQFYLAGKISRCMVSHAKDHAVIDGILSIIRGPGWSPSSPNLYGRDLLLKIHENMSVSHLFKDKKSRMTNIM